MKSPVAATSWSRGTRTGIIAASAGAKKTVVVAKTMFRSSRNVRLWPTEKMATSRIARMTFVVTRTMRRSIRSTYTPARAEKRLKVEKIAAAGMPAMAAAITWMRMLSRAARARTSQTRKVRNRPLTTVLRSLASRTTTVSA